MAYDKLVPPSPVTPTMLPLATELDVRDVSVIVQPYKTDGKKTRQFTLAQLADSEILRFSNVLGGTLTNTITYTGPLEWSNTGSKLCQVTTDPRNQVIFFVEGTSESAGSAQVVAEWTLMSFQYGLKGMVRSHFPFDEQHYDRNDQYISAGSKRYIRDPTDPEGFILVHDESRVCYKGAFMEDPTPLPKVDWASKPAQMRIKTVELWMAGGVTSNPYKLTPPESYTLNIQALIFKAGYDAALLEPV